MNTQAKVAKTISLLAGGRLKDAEHVRTLRAAPRDTRTPAIRGAERYATRNFGSLGFPSLAPSGERLNPKPPTRRSAVLRGLRPLAGLTRPRLGALGTVPSREA